jgi:hypothetical protein
MAAGLTMKYKPLGIGHTVKIKPQVKEHGGKVGRVVYEGQELGWRVVRATAIWRSYSGSVMRDWDYGGHDPSHADCSGDAVPGESGAYYLHQ